MNSFQYIVPLQLYLLIYLSMKNQTLRKYQTPILTQDRLSLNDQSSFNKASYNSLNKYNRSPYLQRITNQNLLKKKTSAPMATQKKTNQVSDQVNKKKELQQRAQYFRSLSNNSNYQLPRVNNILSPNKKIAAFKLPKIGPQDERFQLQKETVKSATLEFSTKKKKLQPLRQKQLKYAIKTKAGTNGKQTKINQDTAFAEQKLQFGLKCFCVCDGHGLNGHIVSAFIKTHLIKNLTLLLKKQTNQPQYDKMQQILYNTFMKTNQNLLDSQINTQLSGSTIVAVFIYKDKIFCLNVGDSRAILVHQIQNNIIETNDSMQTVRPQLMSDSSQRYKINDDKTKMNNAQKMNLSKSRKLQKFSFKLKQLSIDQKPQRQDQRQRVLRNGGRIQCNKTQKGQQIGPLRVWMKDIQMPGLAMTRSFGDKAGLKAGTSDEPQIIQHNITQQDKFIVIASDGVWQYLENDQIMNVVASSYVKDDIEMAAEKVVKLSAQIWGNVSYSRDDISVIVVALNPPYK